MTIQTNGDDCRESGDHVSEDDAAEMQMHMVRACRRYRTASSVWAEMRRAFPGHHEEDIKMAVWPVIKRMYDSI